ncbi:hypothetical protein LXL04_039682, partial [Taraxacum kok-saghyz]
MRLNSLWRFPASDSSDAIFLRRHIPPARSSSDAQLRLPVTSLLRLSSSDARFFLRREAKSHSFSGCLPPTRGYSFDATRPILLRRYRPVLLLVFLRISCKLVSQNKAAA